MFNARDLLGQLLGSGMSGSTNRRIEHASGPLGLGQAGGSLADLFKGLGSGTGGLSDMAQDVLRKVGGSQGKESMAMGGLAALAGAILGGRKGGLGGAVGGGALAMLTGVALNALRQRSATASAGPGETELPVGLRPPQTEHEERQLEDTAVLVIRAMVNAAKADGEIDGGEVARILGKLEEGGADKEARAFVIDEMKKPMDTQALVRDAHTPELAAQVYAASLLAIEIDTDAERAYLSALASALPLTHDEVTRIHEMMGVPVTGRAA